MAPRKKTDRSEAEAAYAALLKDNTALVGDVGEIWGALEGALARAAELRESYEKARASAVKAGAVSNDQLDQMGYKKAPKVPTLPPRTGPQETSGASAAAAESPGAGPQNNGAAAAPPLAPVGARTGQERR